MHDVQAIIAKTEALKTSCRPFSKAVLCPLPQGYSLLPITNEFAKEITELQTQAFLQNAPLDEISNGLLTLAIDVSKITPVAYVTTEYFGGNGGQDAVAWDKGVVCFSPATKGYNQMWPNSPISQALRCIGVIKEEGKDEFDTIGLGNHRETHRWASSVG